MAENQSIVEKKKYKKIKGDIAAHQRRVLHTHAMGCKGRFLREQTNTYLYENIFDR